MASLPPHRLLIASALVVVGLAVLAAPKSGRAGDEEDARPPLVKGVVYEVFHGDGLHRMGFYIREIHLPDRGFSFSVVHGELRVFRPGATRYPRGEKETITFPGPSGEPIELPLFRIPGTEPKRVGPTTLRVEDADRLEALLQEKTRLRAVAEMYLDPSGTYEVVAAWQSANEEAGRFVTGLLEATGIGYRGVGNDGGDSLTVPAGRAEEARRILRKALAAGRERTPADPERSPSWDAHLRFEVIDASLPRAPEPD